MDDRIRPIARRRFQMVIARALGALVPVLLVAACATGKKPLPPCGDGPCADTSIAWQPDATGSCQTVTCSTPPDRVCVDGTQLRVYQPIGSCDRGQCNYQSSTESCPQGCEAGACTGDPCIGVTCSSPPASTCSIDGSRLLVSNSTGVCDQGQCSYQTSETPCSQGCADGACTGEPCAGVTCKLPPANSCQDGQTLTVFNATGTCDGGKCSYQSSTVECAAGCAAGACVDDPCASVTCNTAPANYCSDSDTLMVFSAPGSCSGGSCSYGSATQTCQFGCSGGQCDGDPCAGVTCNTPPANTCVDASTLKAFSSPGSCGGGSCTYSSANETCPFGCNGGQCLADPCANAGQPCDGNDSDKCKEGTFVCNGGTLQCNDTTGNNVEVCNGKDDDCNPATADGSQDPQLGAACDGTDSDKCKEGTFSCAAGALKCSDTTGNTVEICTNLADDDCDGVVNNGCCGNGSCQVGEDCNNCTADCGVPVCDKFGCICCIQVCDKFGCVCQ